MSEAPEVGMPLSLASARWLAAEVNRQRAMGRDIIADMAAAKQRRRIDIETKAYTYPAAVRQFIDEHARPKNRGWRETARVLGISYDADIPVEMKGSLAARWKDRSVGEIDGHDIFAAIDEARRHGIPGLDKRNQGLSDARGRSVARALGKLFSWLLQQRKIVTNPCLGMFVPPPSPSRDQVLTGQELRLIWKSAASLGYPFGPLIRLLLLTGCRRNEVAWLHRSELSEDGLSWTIPASRTKNKKEFLVPLSPEARHLIIEASEFAGDSRYLFTTTGQTAVSGFSKIKMKLDALMKKESGEVFRTWRLHDLRRTVASSLAELKIAPHIIEVVLNHISGFRSGVAGIYNRYRYETEKREALAAWARHLDQIVSGDAGGNVVSIWGKR